MYIISYFRTYWIDGKFEKVSQPSFTDYSSKGFKHIYSKG